MTVHGKDAVVIVSSEAFAKTQSASTSKRTGTDLVAAMQKGAKLGLKLKPLRVYSPTRPPVAFMDDDR